MPKFRPSTEENFGRCCLTDTDRKYVVQTMATMLMTYIQKPSLHYCGVVARALTEKYDFLKDDEGDGEVSLPKICMHIFTVKYCSPSMH